MELGEKIRQARIEAGLSQRQLCADLITRNMLSQIENGSARPSMRTLMHLAERLGKSVGFFLEEAGGSPNQTCMEQARVLYDRGEFNGCIQVLREYKMPDPVFDRERDMLWEFSYLNLAEKAVAERKELYALELLKETEGKIAYCQEALDRRRLLLLGQLRKMAVSEKLPSLDGELWLRAREALEGNQPERAGRLLDAAQVQTSPDWQLLRGRIWMALGQYEPAAFCLTEAEEAHPKEAAPLLEICWRELGDYKKAYEYACKQKK